MFGKLLKQEWIATRRKVGVLCLIIFAAGLVSGGILRYMVWSSVTGNGFMIVIYTILLTVAVLSIVGSCIAAMYLMIYRFAKSRFGDEGHLTFTLPVTTHQQLLASIANTVIAVALVGSAASLSVAIGMGIFLMSYEQNTAVEMLLLITGVGDEILNTLGFSGWSVLLAVAESVLSFLMDVVVLMLAVTVGYAAKKHPILTGFGVYLAVDLTTSGILELLLYREKELLVATAFSCLMCGVVTVAAYLVMHHYLDKKFNLP